MSEAFREVPGVAGSPDEESRLALAYQRGDISVLPALHASLGRVLGPSLRRFWAKGGLPPSIEPADVAQQAWLMLAELAEQWQPRGGSFGAYVRVSLPWMLLRWAARLRPERRAGVALLSAELAEVQRELERQGGDDGREWDERLAWEEVLAQLDQAERRVLALHLERELPFDEVARELGQSRSAIFRLYRRALRRAGRQVVAPERETAGAQGGRLEPDLVAVTRALHVGARTNGIVPGVRRLATATGLTQQRVAGLVERLVADGCIVGRDRRLAGRLAHRSVEAALAALAAATDRSGGA